MSILLSNKILMAAEKKIESQLTPENRQNYLKIIVAGMKVGLDKGPNGILASLTKSKDPLGDCAKGAVNLTLLLSHQSRGTMPVQAMVPGAMGLMLHALDFVDRTGVMKIGNEQLVQATHIFANFLFKQMGVTPQMLGEVANKVHGIMNDPAKMQQIKMHAGFEKHPQAQAAAPAPEAPNAV